MSEPPLFQSAVTIVPNNWAKTKEMMDGQLTLTRDTLSFVYRAPKSAQLFPHFLVFGLIALFIIRALNGTLPAAIGGSFTLSWVLIIGMACYSGWHIYKVRKASDETFRLDIPLTDIAQLADEQLKFIKSRRLLCITTKPGKQHRFAMTEPVFDWIEQVSSALETHHQQKVEASQDGDIPVWKVS